MLAEISNLQENKLHPKPTHDDFGFIRKETLKNPDCYSDGIHSVAKSSMSHEPSIRPEDKIFTPYNELMKKMKMSSVAGSVP